MRGFFSKGEADAPPLLRGCAACPLRGASERSGPAGDGARGWLAVDGRPCAPGAAPFKGAGGSWLRAALRTAGLRMDRDFRQAFAVACADDGADVGACRWRLAEIARDVAPKAAFLFGETAVVAWWGGRDGGGGSIEKWRGLRIPDLERGCWTFPMLNPADAVDDPAAAVVLGRDLEAALAGADEPFPPWGHMDDAAHVTVLEDRRELVRRLRAIPAGSLFAFDLETTGKKPWNAGHDALIAAYSLGQGTSTAFPLEDPVVRRELCRTLERPDLYLSAHQLQFEDMWARRALGARPANWAWDSMLAAHALDNRRGITSLEWQAFQRYGAIGFKDDTDPWLKNGGDSAHSFNQLRERMKDPGSRRKLLLRCGLDALYGGRLTMDQMREIGTWPWDK